MVILSAFEVLPIAGLSLIGAVLVMLTRCVDPAEAFDAIDWRILFLIFGMLGLSMGLEQSGAAAMIVTAVVAAVGDLGPLSGLLWAVLGRSQGLPGRSWEVLDK